MGLLIQEYSKTQTILLVEDGDSARLIAQKTLENYFKKVDTAINGQEAFSLYEKNPKKYDIVFTDIDMPVMDGITLIKKIKDICYSQQIIVISSVETSNQLLEILEIGITKFLSKPITIDKLEQVLYRTCMEISDSILTSQYEEKMIEMTVTEMDKNKKLQQRVEELENELNTLKNFPEHTEDKNIKTEIKELEEPIVLSSEIISAYEFHENYPTDLDIKNQQLESLNESLDLTISNFLSRASSQTVDEVSKIFISYGEVIEGISHFTLLGYSIHKMGQSLKEIRDFSKIEQTEEILYSISSNLDKWRYSIFEERTSENINEFDQMLIADCKQVEAIIDPQSVTSGGIELF
ncbi:MAG: response regulator [Campylobacterales bacterium]|nr:response regulator [Campylobacterales bacterium]